MDKAVLFHRVFETAAPQVQIIQYLSKLFPQFPNSSNPHSWFSFCRCQYFLSFEPTNHYPETNVLASGLLGPEGEPIAAASALRMHPSKNSGETIRMMEMRNSKYIPSMPHTLSQDPSIPTLSLTGEDGSSCPLYTPEESILTPPRSVQAESMLDNGFSEPDGSIESPSPDRRPFPINNTYTTPEMSFNADNDLSSDRSNRSIHEYVVHHGMSLDNINWDAGVLRTPEARFNDGDYMYPLEEEHMNPLEGR